MISFQFKSFIAEDLFNVKLNGAPTVFIVIVISHEEKFH
jgi:hypothetical protein